MAYEANETSGEYLFPRHMGTARLVLRTPELDDALPIFANFGSDPLVTRYLTWKPSRSVSETESFLRFCIDDWESGNRYAWAIVIRETDQIAGMIEARISRHMVETGFVLGRSFWGQGYATEALRALIDAAFRNEGVWRFWAYCDVDNLPSARVMEKAGMQCEGRLHRYAFHPNLGTEPRDVYIYAVVRDQGAGAGG